MKEVLKLKPTEKLVIIETLLESLDYPDKAIDEIWEAEAEKRLTAFRNGKLDTISMEDALK